MNEKPKLKAKRLGIDTYKEAVVFLRADCPVCHAEGLEVRARVLVRLNGQSLIATLNIVSSNMLDVDEAGFSDVAWAMLKANYGDPISVSPAPPVQSFSHVHSKIFGNRLHANAIDLIVRDIVSGRYTDVQISSFLTACAGGQLNAEEVISLTRAMVSSGDRLEWGRELVVDKHCVGGLPGNRTTPIIVAIVAAFGLIMPKTSSRAITSPAGTADTMEVLAPVDLDIKTMRRVVEAEQGCIVWGGSVSISPADDLLIRVEKELDLDSEGQLVASVLSKKIAAGSTHVLIDIPVGATAKVRSMDMAEHLSRLLEQTGNALGISVRVHDSDGSQPVGRGIGPALEARDIVQVLTGHKDAPLDLTNRALDVAGHVLEFSPNVKSGQGRTLAADILHSGKAWNKFQAICEAQGGMREIPKAGHTYQITAQQSGRITAIDNRRIARIAKLAGAPTDKVAGVDLHTSVDETVTEGQPLFTIHANSRGELDYALAYLEDRNHIVQIAEA